MVRWLSIVCMGIFLIACATSPTGQIQLQLFPEEQIEMGQAVYQEIKQQTPISQDPQVNQYVRCVAAAVIQEVEGDASWEVTVFQGNTANALALLGGKIGVNTGMLDMAENQHQLATVIGHEIAHMKANHSNARLSASYATQAGLATGAASPEKQQLLGLLGLGAQVGVLLPYGRAQESGGDILGLTYMARAGFDLQQSIALWQSMEGGWLTAASIPLHPSIAR